MTGLIQSHLISPWRDHFAPMSDSTSTDKHKVETTLKFKHITYYTRLDSFLIANINKVLIGKNININKIFFYIDTSIIKKNIL